MTAATAAIAAPDAALAPDAPAPDPLLGAWGLLIDGQWAGPLQSVEGCGVTGEIVEESGGPAPGAKHLNRVVAAPCEAQWGSGMKWGFYSAVNELLLGKDGTHTMTLARMDGSYSLELLGARVSALTIPRVAPAGLDDSMPMKVSLSAEQIRPARGRSLPAVLFPPGIPLNPHLITDAGLLDLTEIGPWTVKAREPEGDVRDYTPAAAPPEVGNLSLRAPETAVGELGPWLQSSLLEGNGDERTVTIGIGSGVNLRLENVGVAAGDLGPRADGARKYSFYVERASFINYKAPGHA